MNRLDPRSPLVLDTRELVRKPGAMLEVDRTVPAPEPLGTDLIAIPEGGPLGLTLRLESVVEGVLVSGSVEATAVGACVRCLEPATVPVSATFQELFAYPDKSAHHHQVEPDLEDDEVHELVGDLVDLEPVIRDAVVPTLPFQPVCRADCPGLCSECGALLADDPTHHHEILDPRWATLAALVEGTDAAPQHHQTTPSTTRENRN